MICKDRNAEISLDHSCLPSVFLLRRRTCITLNNANGIIQKRAVTFSLLDKSLFNPRDVYADVITDRAAAVIFAHNHPSGNLQQSDEDIHTQIRLVEAAKIFGTRVLDHLIVSRKGYLSFQESSLTGA
jgi:DNA repair protein RadC